VAAPACCKPIETEEFGLDCEVLRELWADEVGVFVCFGSVVVVFLDWFVWWNLSNCGKQKAAQSADSMIDGSFFGIVWVTWTGNDKSENFNSKNKK